MTEFVMFPLRMAAAPVFCALTIVIFVITALLMAVMFVVDPNFDPRDFSF